MWAIIRAARAMVGLQDVRRHPQDDVCATPAIERFEKCFGFN